VTTLIERAFELARSGDFRSVAEIERRLSREGYTFPQVQGQIGAPLIRAPLIRRQLSSLCRWTVQGERPTNAA
jgi:hypothetical protein